MTSSPATVTRYVVTHVGHIGLRTLTFAMQGKWTYDTPEAARAALDAWSKPQGLARVLEPEQLKTLGVCAVQCYAGHHDPVRCYFDEDEVIPCGAR